MLTSVIIRTAYRNSFKLGSADDAILPRRHLADSPSSGGALALVSPAKDNGRDLNRSRG